MRNGLTALVFAAALAGGCAVQRPTAEVTGVRVGDATDEGSRVVVTVALHNRSDTPLPIRETRYTLQVDGEEFAFTDVAPATIPASGTQTLRLPAAVRIPASAIDGRTYEVSGQATYVPPGEIRDLLTDSGVPLPSVSFSGSGRLSGTPADAAPDQ